MDVDEILMEEEEQPTQTAMFNPITILLQFLAAYGWWLALAVAAMLWLYHKLRPTLDAWRQAKEDAEYHKDPDKALARMEAIQAARERQQRLLEEASSRALEQQKEREERKKRELAERLEKYGAATAGNKLGSEGDNDGYLPLSGGASTSSYKAPKRKACGGGGCGR